MGFLKSIYGMTNSGKLFANALTEWLLEAGFIKSQFQISIYYNYSQYDANFLFYSMLITMSIGIYQKLLENGLRTL